MVPLCSNLHSRSIFQSEGNCNPFLGGEKSLCILKSRLKTWVVGNGVLSLVWMVLLATSVTLHVWGKEHECNFSIGFRIMGIGILTLLTLRYLGTFFVGAAALYYCAKFCKKPGFQRLARGYPQILEDVTCGRWEGIHRHVIESGCTPSTKATIDMGRDLDMFHLVKELTSLDSSSWKRLNSLAHKDTVMALNEAFETLDKPCGKGLKVALTDKDKGQKCLKPNLKPLGFLFTWGCLDTVPLLTVILYILIGTETSDYQPIPVHTGHVCADILTFNWVMVGIFLLHNIFSTSALCLKAFVSEFGISRN